MTNHASLISYPWIALGVIWLAAAATRKPVLRRQPGARRIATHLVVGLGFAMNAGTWLEFGWLARRFVPDSNGAFYTGFAITVAGTAFAVWARLVLGGNWSGTPTLLAGQELVTKGPYSIARHPIYTGLLLAAAGTAISLGEWRNLLGGVVIVIGFLLKIRDEEALMMEAFPKSYAGYRDRVKAIVPGVF